MEVEAYSGYSGYSGAWVREIRKFDRDLAKRMKVITGHEAVQLQKDFYESKTSKKAPHSLFDHAESCRMWFRNHKDYWNSYQARRRLFLKNNMNPPKLGRGGFRKLFDSILSKDNPKK